MLMKCFIVVTIILSWKCVRCKILSYSSIGLYNPMKIISSKILVFIVNCFALTNSETFVTFHFQDLNNFQHFNEELKNFINNIMCYGPFLGHIN